jgi:hypothetical protein
VRACVCARACVPVRVPVCVLVPVRACARLCMCVDIEVEDRWEDTATYYAATAGIKRSQRRQHVLEYSPCGAGRRFSQNKFRAHYNRGNCYRKLHRLHESVADLEAVRARARNRTSPLHEPVGGPPRRHCECEQRGCQRYRTSD